MTPLNPRLQEVTWQEVRASVKKVDKLLAELIDQIDPDSSYKLIKATYFFGDLILRDGIVQIPYGNEVIAISDLAIDAKLRSMLTYSKIPLFLTLTNCNEVFIDTGHRIIPLNLFQKGSLLGLFETTDFMFNRSSQPKWSVSAGARSIFMLPKINESNGFKRLRMRYGLSANIELQQIADHWQIFKKIASHPNFSQSWHNEVLFFSKEWVINQPNDPSWMRFHHYLFQHAWSQAQFAIGKIDLSLAWQAFTDAISTRKLKPTPYLANQVKHIMQIATGEWPGFGPANHSQEAAPITGLQDAFAEVYLLKQYLPTIIHTYLRAIDDPLAVYYSLAHPTLLEGSHINRSSSTIMLDLRDIKLLLEILVQSSEDNEKFGNALFKNMQFDYFHVEPDQYNEIRSSRYIVNEDNRFQQALDRFPNREFCATSPFWRGCIRIKNK